MIWEFVKNFALVIGCIGAGVACAAAIIMALDYAYSTLEDWLSTYTDSSEVISCATVAVVFVSLIVAAYKTIFAVGG